MKFVYTKFIMKGNNPDMGSIFHIKNQWNIHGHRKIQNSKFNASILLGYLTNTDASIRVYKFRAERTGFNVCTQIVRNCNKLSLHYNLGLHYFRNDFITNVCTLSHLCLYFVLWTILYSCELFYILCLYCAI